MEGVAVFHTSHEGSHMFMDRLKNTSCMLSDSSEMFDGYHHNTHANSLRQQSIFYHTSDMLATVSRLSKEGNWSDWNALMDTYKSFAHKSAACPCTQRVALTRSSAKDLCAWRIPTMIMRRTDLTRFALSLYAGGYPQFHKVPTPSSSSGTPTLWVDTTRFESAVARVLRRWEDNVHAEHQLTTCGMFRGYVTYENITPAYVRRVVQSAFDCLVRVGDSHVHTVRRVHPHNIDAFVRNADAVRAHVRSHAYPSFVTVRRRVLSSTVSEFSHLRTEM